MFSSMIQYFATFSANLDIDKNHISHMYVINKGNQNQTNE